MGDEGWPIRRINPNVPAKEKSQFVDRYAEMHFELKKMLHTGMLILPRDDVLLEQMRLRRYKLSNTDDNRVRIEPKAEAKKRKESSPDRLDVLAHLISDMPALPNVRQRVHEMNRTPSPKEFWAAQKKDEESSSMFGNDWD